MLVFFVLKHLAPSFYCYYCYYYSHFYCFFYFFFYFYCYFMLLLLVIVQRAAFSTGCYQRAKIFTTDRGRPNFAPGNYGEQTILSTTHIYTYIYIYIIHILLVRLYVYISCQSIGPIGHGNCCYLGNWRRGPSPENDCYGDPSYWCAW